MPARKSSIPDIAVFYRTSATGQLTAALLKHLCNADVEIRPLRDGRDVDPIAAKVLEEVRAEAEVPSPERKLRPAYREVIYITDDHLPKRRSTEFPRGSFRVWRVPTLDPGSESDYVRLIRARIVRSMLLSKLEHWCRDHCSQGPCEVNTAYPEGFYEALPGTL